MWCLKTIGEIIVLFVFFSCSKEAPKENERDKISTAGSHQYRITEAYTPTAVDINMDGKYNTDLFQEMSYLKKDPIIIDFDIKNIKIFWEEPRINNDRLGMLPNRYSDDMLLRFYPTINNYRYVMNEKRFEPVEDVESSYPDGRTFIFPQYVYFEGSRGLTFKTQQKILTRDEGIKYIEINAVYEYEKKR